MLKHAKLSASGSARWLNCAGSVKAEEGYSDKGSFFAAEGTAAHALADFCLSEQCSADNCIGRTFEGFVVDNYMAEFVQQYVDYVRQHSGVMYFEERVDFSPWVPEGFGTSDCIVIDGDTLRVIDLKYGKGVRVDADNNSQAMLYALGALNGSAAFLDIKRIVCAIVQPRLDHISEWEISYDDLIAWGETIKPKAKLALTDNAPRTPHEKACEWCKAKPTCPEQRALVESVILIGFDALDTHSPAMPDKLTDAQLRQALEHKKLIVSWLDSVESLITERLEAGEAFDGFKLVAGRSLRKWADEESAAPQLVELLGEKAHTQTLISPAQAEKVLGKAKAKLVADLIVKPEGRPTLAREDDSRPAINCTADDFDAC